MSVAARQQDRGGAGHRAGATSCSGGTQSLAASPHGIAARSRIAIARLSARPGLRGGQGILRQPERRVMFVDAFAMVAQPQREAGQEQLGALLVRDRLRPITPARARLRARGAAR